jgi:membrane glycosyltransferase
LVDFGTFYFGYITYCIFPVLISVFCILADEKKMAIANHKVGSIIIYVVFALWGIGAILEIIGMIQLLANITLLWILSACLIGANITTGVFGFLYWHSVKSNAALNGDAPLLNTQV